MLLLLSSKDQISCLLKHSLLNKRLFRPTRIRDDSSVVVARVPSAQDHLARAGCASFTRNIIRMNAGTVSAKAT